MSRLRKAVLAGTAAVVALVTGPAGAAVTPAEPVAIELKAPKPAWYTDELDAQVRANSERGVVTPIPEGGLKDIPTSGLAFLGIRPGSWILSPAGCTANFIFQSSGSTFDPTQQLYVGTAGHCASVGQSVTMVLACPGTNPLGGLINVGTVTRSNNNGVGDDFALIEIRPNLNFCVSPSMAHWGGPTGTYTSNALTAVVHSGHGLVLGTGGTPRAGVLLYSDSNARYWIGGTIFGDSGSALNTYDGKAIANITHLIVDTRKLGANSAGTRIEKILQIAGKPLSVCPTRTPWPLAGCPLV